MFDYNFCDNVSSGGAITTNSYNADGLRVEEDHDGVIKRLVYDGNNVQLETDDVGDLLVDYTYVPNNYGMALSQRRDGDSSFYLADGTQDVRQLTDSVQSVTDEYEFDAWGNSLSSTGGTPNAQQYKGQQLAYRADPDAGPELQYALHFRQYDPHTARFTSRDPAEDDLNLYRYVKNNPVNEVDPSGLDPTRDALDVVDKLLTVEVLKLKFLGGLAYGVFVNELWGTAVDAVEGAGSQIKAGAKLGSFVARSIYGYVGGDTAAMRAAEDAAIEQFTTVEQAAEFFEQAGPTMAAIFSDIAPNGTLDGLEPETIAFIEAIKPELAEIQGILVAKWQKATPEDIAWKLGEIVAPILLGAATMGVGMVAQGGKLSAAVAQVKKTLGRLGLDEKNAQRVVELANRIFGKLKTTKQKVSGKRTGNGDNRPRGHSVEQANELDSPGLDMHQPDGTKEGPAQAPKPENGNGSPDAPSLPDTHTEPVAPSGDRKWVFRGDSNYKGGTVGRTLGAEADAADIQNFADHVLRKESRHSSRYTSFTTETKVARKFPPASDNRYVNRALMEQLRELEAKGQIKIWTPDDVYEALRNGPKKLSKRAADVRAAMQKNGEILIEGQIPEGILKGAN